MLIKRTKPYEIKDSELTSIENYNRRETIMKALALGALALPLGSSLQAQAAAEKSDFIQRKFFFKKDPAFPVSKLTPNSLTPEKKAITYNNYYEFGVQKEDPSSSKAANEVFSKAKLDPWSVVIDGLVEKPVKLSLETIVAKMPLVERNYHFRCVEAWSMNLPYMGFRLKDLLAVVKPLSSAKFVHFETIVDPEMPAVKSPSIAGGIKFPYIEGLRLDEAYNDLTLLAIGLYGKALLPQSGAPLRLVVPWKYGFKSIKSIVRISFVDKLPSTMWVNLASDEYGFYANVNPNVPHPRWSQASENYIGDSFFNERIPTKMFNGYGEEVASMYKGMDLTKNF
ncbi:protein-methionine-sulfoxide reductase catalytic subunit MsrP [Helicobacter sp. 11S02629-2]|uniref:protein-methionine-sulfoxide reductase catalytic subunit MsrP n=1 Tax=Helicobacter sp. 11S02629-2 TaxID=1476195 RepID=UPI000BA67790|nr:protein-methionine-sulfoxide reductase catalytic subunit MsrP [Helicobacter sp. 11S02629-2]PAF45310.1 mononuclear molybdenum enzyme YedY [Helicobacter sp. 11S02629-2]